MTNDELLLGILNHYRNQLKMQREVTDRWFRYYLLIIGIPFIILGAVSEREPQLVNPLSVMAISLFLFIVGLFFLLMNTRQRINVIRFHETIKLLERSIYGKLGMTYGELRTEPHGADFYIALVQIFINSSWFTVFIYTFYGQQFLVRALLDSVVIFGLQYFLRDKLLEKNRNV